ncbi:MAG: VOC family protein [Acidobacteriota bacterium]
MVPYSESSQIYPYLRYRNARAAIDWLIDTFGFEPQMIVDGPDDTIAHAQLRLGDSVIMLGEVDDAAGERSPLDLPGVSGGLYAFVPDVDTHYERAKDGGAEIVRELATTDYGEAEYSARDLEGHHWSFGSYRPDGG